MGDCYSGYSDIPQNFVRGVLDYLKNPSEIGKKTLQDLAEKLDQTRSFFSYDIRLSKDNNLNVMLDNLRDGNWNTWRKLYFQSGNMATMGRVESASPWEEITTFGYIQV